MRKVAHSSALHRRHRAIALWCAVLVAAMVGAAYAAVPLYRLFCEATGFDGTPRVASKPSQMMLDRTVTVRFDANVGPGLAWRFEPVEKTMSVRIGENVLAFYRATNLSDRPLHGMATYNVFPEQAAPFFNKLECFCFKEQVLEPGESVEMPVSFFIDPHIVSDKDAGSTTHLTLSYTFYPYAPAKPGIAGSSPGAVKPPGGNGAGPEGRPRTGRAG
jgi:cytochrome c oxidase assembly protein subunit 11